MRQPKGVLAAVLVGGIAALGIAGCGGGSSTSETVSQKSEPLSSAEYVKQADAICAKADNRQEALLKEEFQARQGKGTPSESERVAFVLNSGIPPLKEEAEQLDALSGPAGQEGKAEALVAALEQAIEDVEENPAAFSEGKSQAFAPVERLARELQLKECGGP